MPTSNSTPDARRPLGRRPLTAMASGASPLGVGTPSASGYDPRSLPIYELYRRLRRDLLALEPGLDRDAVAERFLAAVVSVSTSAGPLVVGGRVYRRQDDGFVLLAKRGEAGQVPLGYRLPNGYPIVDDLLRSGWAVVRPGDPRLDPAIEAPIAADNFAAVALGEDGDYLLALTLRETVDEDELRYALMSLGSIADMALRHRELMRSFGEARDVQTSLLLEQPPELEHFDVAFRSRPAEIVGGDVYDLQAISPATLGVSIGDACGHGLPAALQARDLVVGLRMGAEQSFKLVKTIDCLSRVMASSGPPGRFISVFCCEIDVDGTLVYVNAGHVPPVVLRRDGSVTVLRGTGPVLGVPAALSLGHRRAFERLEPGDLLVAYTDGITETRDADDQEWGLDGLLALIRRHRRGASAEELVDVVFAELELLDDTAPQADDRTLLILSRHAV